MLKKVSGIVGLITMCCIGMETKNELLKPFTIAFDDNTDINCVLSNEYECYWVELPGRTLEVKEKFETNSIEGFLTTFDSSELIKSPRDVYEYLKEEYSKRTCKKDKLMPHGTYPSSLCPKLISFLRSNIASLIVNKVNLLREESFNPLIQKLPIMGSVYEAHYDGSEKVNITANRIIKDLKSDLNTENYRCFLSKEKERGTAELTFEASKFVYDYLRKEYENRQFERIGPFLKANDPLEVLNKATPYGSKKRSSLGSVILVTYTGHYENDWTIISNKCSDCLSANKQWDDFYYGFLINEKNNYIEELSLEVVKIAYKHLQKKHEQQKQEEYELQKRNNPLPQSSITSPPIKRYRKFTVQK